MTPEDIAAVQAANADTEWRVYSAGAVKSKRTEKTYCYQLNKHDAWCAKEGVPSTMTLANVEAFMTWRHEVCVCVGACVCACPDSAVACLFCRVP